MKIAVINSMDNGSTGKIALDCVKGSNIEYRFFVGRKHLDNEAILFTKKWERGGHSILSQLLDVDEKCSRISTIRLIKELKKFKPDIIHLHNLHGYYINYVMLFKYIKSIDVKVVWTLHDCWAFTGHCAYFDYVECEKWKTHCEHCPNLQSYPSSKFFDRSKKLYNIKKQTFTGVKNMTIVCPSKWLANLVKQSFLKDYPIKVINNGINLDNFKPTDNHTFDNIIDRNKKILLGVASSWGKRKGYEDFLRLNQIIDKSKYQIVMVGVNNQQKEELNHYGIIGIKRTENQNQLAELYSISYCFLNLTYEDNFPTVNIEALSCGCPIITYATGGSVEVVNKNNGIIIPKGKYEQIIGVLSHLGVLRNNSVAFMNEARKKFANTEMQFQYNVVYKNSMKEKVK